MILLIEALFYKEEKEMFKKATSLLLSLMLIVTSLSVTIFSVSAADTNSTFVVAGMPEFCGTEWDGNPATSPDNVMTATGDGTFEKVFTDVAPAESLQVKVVENTTDGSQIWYGQDGGENNVTFNVTDTCDVTVTFDPTTNYVTVSGDGVEMVTSLDVEKVIAVGNGDGNWLNGANWDPADDSNKMEEIAPGVYSITYTDIEMFSNYEVKFAANGSWADSWGLPDGQSVVSGVEMDAKYNGGNITVDVPYELADVTLKLDLSNFDYATKSGAKMTITVVDAQDEPGTTVPETSAPEVTTEPQETTVPATTAPEATTEPTESAQAPLTVTATSNFFPEAKGEYNADTDTVTVTYMLKSDMKFINTQYTVYYDSDVLTLSESDNPASQAFPRFVVDVPGVGEIPVGSVVYNYDLADEFKFNASNLSLYDFTTEAAFVQLNFKVKDGALDAGAVDTTVNLEMEVLSGSTGELSETDVPFVDNSVVNEDNVAQYNVETKTAITESSYVAPTTSATEATETTAPTEATDPTVPSEPVGDATYVVAGMPALCGTEWDGNPQTSPDNVMTENADGTYTKVFKAVAPAESLQLKVVENLADGTQNWYGQDGGENNVTFNVTAECDVTVTFDPATKFVTVSGDGVEMVTDLDVEKVIAVGNGDGNWLNGVNWDPADDSNMLEEVADGLYTITYEDIEMFANYEVKFAANGSWADSWGIGEGQTVVSGVEMDATYNGSNIVVDVPYELADVTLTLDLRNFDYATKSGAKMTITVEEKETPLDPTDPTDPTVPAEAPLTVTATSNFFPETKGEYNADTDTITVTYLLKSDMKFINTQYTVHYDSDVLTLSESDNPASQAFPKFVADVPGVGEVPIGSVVYNYDLADQFKFNASNLSLYDFTTESVFVQLNFKVKDGALDAGAVDTTVDLEMEVLSGSTGNLSDPDTLFVNHSVVDEDNVAQYNVETKTTITESSYVAPTTPATSEPTEPAFTVTASSNLFPAQSYVWDNSKTGEDYVSVVFMLDTDKKLLDTQWTLSYDPAYLELVDNNVMPYAAQGAEYAAEAGKLTGSCTNLGLYDLSASDNEFVVATFKVLNKVGTTNVDLTVTDLTLSDLGDNGMTDEAQEEALVVNGDVQQIASPYTVNTVITQTTVEQPSTGDTEPSGITEPSTGATEPSTDVTTETTQPVTTDASDETTAPTTSTDATSGIGGGSTSDTPTGGSSVSGGTTSGGTVQTGNASMAAIILLVLVSASGVMYFTRKRAK